MNGKLHPEAEQVQKNLSSEEIGGMEGKNSTSKVHFVKSNFRNIDSIIS